MWDPAWDPRAERDTVEKLVKGIKTGVGNSAATPVSAVIQQGHTAAGGEHGEDGWMVPLTLWVLSITFFLKSEIIKK